MPMHACPMMSGPGGVVMMIVMGAVWILVLVTLILSIAALVKYMRSGPRS